MPKIDSYNKNTHKLNKMCNKGILLRDLGPKIVRPTVQKDLT